MRSHQTRPRLTLVLPGLMAMAAVALAAGAILGERAARSDAASLGSATMAISAPSGAQPLSVPFQVDGSLTAFTPGTSTTWGGYDFELLYDTAVLQANSDARGLCTSAGWGPVSTSPHVITGCAFQSSSATGVLESITLQCLTNGSSALTLLPRNDPRDLQVGTALFDENGNDFVTTLVNATVTCGSAPTPTPTNTPVVTNTATSTATNAPPPTNTPSATSTPTNTPSGPTATPTNTRTPVSGPVTLNGEWAPFTRCPVDDPSMLAADGRQTVGYCIAAGSPSGSIKLGNSTSVTGDSNLQFGFVNTVPGTIVSLAGGVILAAPVDVPGGLLGLMCPSLDPLVMSVCNLVTSDSLNRVTATVEGAGAPSDFNFDAGLQMGVPIVTLPIKVHLENPLLGSTCYIGMDTDPIVLRPANTDLSKSTFQTTRFDTNGTPNVNGPLQAIKLNGVGQGDDQFAVPGANGCGLAGALDGAINLKEGLPSAAGNNYIKLDNASTYIATFASPGLYFPTAGQQFADAWFSAICPCATPTAVATATATPLLATPTFIPTVAGGVCGGDIDCDGCPDTAEPFLSPPTDPVDRWDFFSVPVPALFAMSNAAGVTRDNAVMASDAQAVFAYFRAGAVSGTPLYEQDLNGNGVKDGVEYDRSVLGPGRSGPPDGVVSASDAQLAFAQFKFGYACP